ncbi:hypothetical protein BVRB_038650, partial [Beta vulgaris subsp. vulgaris]
DAGGGVRTRTLPDAVALRMKSDQVVVQRALPFELFLADRTDDRIDDRAGFMAGLPSVTIERRSREEFAAAFFADVIAALRRVRLHGRSAREACLAVGAEEGHRVGMEVALMFVQEIFGGELLVA